MIKQRKGSQKQQKNTKKKAKKPRKNSKEMLIKKQVFLFFNCTSSQYLSIILNILISNFLQKNSKKHNAVKKKVFFNVKCTTNARGTKSSQ